MDTFFGLDFGTSNSTLSVNIDGKVRLLEIDKANQNQFSLKSVLYFDEEARIFTFGQDAVNAYIENDAFGRYIQSIKSFLPDRLFTSTDIAGRSYEITDLVAVILREIKKRGEAIIGQEVQKVVLGRPVVFSINSEADALAEKRLLIAAEKAGFSEVIFQQEPVAAAIACVHKIDCTEEKIILIGDFGGGTSDFAVVRMLSSTIDQEKIGEVLSVSGVHVGGNDFDSQIMWDKVTKYFGRFAKIRSMGGIITGSGDGITMPSGIMQELCQWHKIPRLRNPKMLKTISEYRYLVEPRDKGLIENLKNLIEDNYGYMLFRAIESAKIALSSQDLANISFKERKLIIDEDLSRLDFEEMLVTFVAEINASINQALIDAGINSSDVGIVSLTGGSSLVSCIGKIFSSKFGEDKILRSDAFTSVAFGLGSLNPFL